MPCGSQLLVDYSKNHFTCEVLDGQVTDERYRVMDGVIYYHDQIFLTRDSKLKEKVLHVAHDSLLSGHQGFIRTYRAFRERLSWEGLKEDLLQHIRKCVFFLKNEEENNHPARLLQPLTFPGERWESPTMEFITNLQTIHGKSCVFVLIVHLTKYLHSLSI